MEKHINHMEYTEGMEKIESHITDEVVKKMKRFDYSSFKAADVKELF